MRIQFTETRGRSHPRSHTALAVALVLMGCVQALATPPAGSLIGNQATATYKD